VNAKGAAELIGVSVRHWTNLIAQGRVPASAALGRRQTWDVAELVRWSAAGLPDREAWEARIDR